MPMPRIRTIKPELFCHVKLFQAEMIEQLPLRLAFIALFTCCDDKGRFTWELPRLKIHTLPYDDKVSIGEVLDALVLHGFVQKYEYEGELYGCIPSWSRHQKLNAAEESRLPSPEESRLINVKRAIFAKPISELSEVNSTTEEVTPVFTPLSIQLKEGEKVLDETTVQEADEISSKNEGFLDEKEPSFPKRKGKEGKGTERKGSNIDLTAQPTIRTEAAFIFEHWKTVMNHPDAKLDPKRERCIYQALKFGYSAEQLCSAINGCSLTPHNMGQNEQGQRYDGLQVILRSSDQIDRFMHNYHYPPRVLNEAERRTQSNIQSLQRWVEQKMVEAT